MSASRGFDRTPSSIPFTDDTETEKDEASKQLVPFTLLPPFSYHSPVPLFLVSPFAATRWGNRAMGKVGWR